MFRIDLGQLTEDGEEFSFSQDSEEVQGLFVENLGENRPFKIQLKATPQANFYSLTGSIEAAYEDVCSRCGYPVELELASRINEMLILDKSRPRKHQSNHQLETEAGGLGDLAVSHIESLDFDAGSFLNELIVMAREDYPKCSNIELCDSQIHRLDKVPQPKPEDTNPLYAALQGIKGVKS